MDGGARALEMVRAAGIILPADSGRQIQANVRRAPSSNIGCQIDRRYLSSWHSHSCSDSMLRKGLQDQFTLQSPLGFARIDIGVIGNLKLGQAG